MPETKGDRHGALQEFLQAYTLEPANPQYREDYQRLLKELRQWPPAVRWTGTGSLL